MIHLSLTDTLLALVPLLPVLGIYLYWHLASRDLVLATARMVLQLVLIGFILNHLFNSENTWLGILILSFMLLVSGFIVIRPIRKKSTKGYYHVIFSLGIAGTFTLFWTLKIVLHLTPWYQPNIVIPVAGMILANGMNALSLCAERLEKELERNEAIASARSLAFNAALIPQINAFLAVGLVALPGMMTGQILSGVSPLIAVRYQILVMSIVMATACIAVFLYLWLQIRDHQRALGSEKE